MKLKKSLALLISVLCIPTIAQIRYTIIDIADIPGYRTLKCDFHLHTVHSDGHVTPDFTVENFYITPEKRLKYSFTVK